MKRVLLIMVLCFTIAGLYIVNGTVELVANRIDWYIANDKQCVIRGLPKLIGQVKLSTVHIRVNNTWQGSGVIINEHTVLTARHVVDGAENIEIMLSNGYFLRSRSFYKDPNNDCGVIKFKESFLPSRVAPLSDSNSITVGLPILTVGSPYGDMFFNTVSFGIVSGFGRHMSYRWPDVATLDCLADPGYSGGPVFNMEGKIIGVVVGTYSRYGNATVITPIHILRKMLADYEKEGTNGPVGARIRSYESEGQEY